MQVNTWGRVNTWSVDDDEGSLGLADRHFKEREREIKQRADEEAILIMLISLPAI